MSRSYQNSNCSLVGVLWWWQSFSTFSMKTPESYLMSALHTDIQADPFPSIIKLEHIFLDTSNCGSNEMFFFIKDSYKNTKVFRRHQVYNLPIIKIYYFDFVLFSNYYTYFVYFAYDLYTHYSLYDLLWYEFVTFYTYFALFSSLKCYDVHCML